MVNIKCINRKEKITKISKISKVRKCLKYNMVDIIQQVNQRNRRKERAFISAFILIFCMCLTGCRNGNDIVKDYGARSETEDKQNGESSEKISANGKTVREMVGGATLEFEDSLDINGFPIYIDIKSAVIDVPALNVYQVHRVSDGKKDEDEIVKNLFGDTAVKLDEILSDMDNNHTIAPYSSSSSSTVLSISNNSTGMPDIMGAYYDVINELKFDEEDEFENVEMKWRDDDNGYIHLYQGKYEGIDFILLCGYSDLSKTRTIMFTPLSVGDFISNSEYDSVFIYNDEENKLAETILPDNDENRLSYSPENMVYEASSFLRDKLGINVYDGMISAEIKDMWTESDGKNELVFVSSKNYNNILDKHTVKMKNGGFDFDIGVRDIQNEIANTGLFDGYEMYFPDKFSGVPCVYESELYVSPKGYTNILITSKGVMSVRLSRRIEVTDIVENVQILDGDKIKESFKAALLDAVDKMLLDGMKQLTFVDMKLRYYPVQNPSDENEYTYIPVWEFSTKRDTKNQGDKVFYVYINAIDGTLVDVVD